MNYKNIIKKLKCEDIPDTKRLQQIRLNSFGKVSGDEEFIKEHYPEKYKLPRIVSMPEEEIKQVYSLAIPLTFPLGDPISYGNGCYTFYFRWTSGDCQKGAMHLTTGKNMNKLINLFSRNNINIKAENSFGKLLDMDILKDWTSAGISVPHSWHVDNYDPHQELFEHQFVVFENKIHACPYFYSEKKISHTQEEDNRNSSIIITDNIEKSIELCCRGTFYIPEYQNPEEYLPELLKKYEENLKESHSNWRVSQSKDKEISNSLELRLLNIGNPIEIYNPGWLNN
jgi:hypothetical protein